MPSPVMIEFSFPQTGEVSEPYGPYPYVQLTYNTVRVGEDAAEELAYLEEETGLWKVGNQYWSDFAIFAQEGLEP